jgi:hypothetical protein
MSPKKQHTKTHLLRSECRTDSGQLIFCMLRNLSSKSTEGYTAQYSRNQVSLDLIISQVVSEQVFAGEMPPAEDEDVRW